MSGIKRHEEHRIVGLVAAAPGWRVLLPNYGQPVFEDIGAWAQTETRWVVEGCPEPTWRAYPGLLPLINMGNGGLDLSEDEVISPSESADPEIMAARMEEARKMGQGAADRLPPAMREHFTS